MTQRNNSVKPMPTPGSAAPASTVKHPGARMFVALMTISAGGFAAWQGHEGYTPTPVIPTKGDVPTIGHGSTRYEDGRRVRMGDPAIDRKRAAELARNLMREDERAFAATLPDVKLNQVEYDLYIDFVGQYGLGNWRKSSMRSNLLAGNYAAACQSLLKYRFAAGYDCSTTINGKPNRRCWGVWTRQKDRFDKCMASQ